VPTTATLQTGEIAINTADGLVYIRKDDDTIIPLIGANTTVTGSVVILGSIEATSFSGSFEGPLNGTLSRTVGSGDGIVSFLFDGSENVTVTLDTGSDHFRSAVINLIDTNAPSIIAQDTTGAGGIDLSYNSETGALSGSLVNSSITIGQTEIDLGATAEAINGLQLTDVIATGSFSGSFTGELLTTASWAYNAVSASYSLVATSASYAAFTTSASYAATTDNAVSASYAATATSASHALIADYALNVNVNTGSLLETGSISNATITLTKVNGTSFDLTVNNVATASLALLANTASYSERAVSSSYAAFATSASYALYTAFAEDAISASYAATASSANDFLVRGDATVNGDLTVDGIVTAREFHTQFISASITYDSGSNKFGDSADDIHQFTGSVIVSGSIDSDDITINDWGSVSASLALLNASSSATTLQQVTDNGNTTTNEVIINNQLQVSESIYSRGEEVLDFAVAMAIALG
jgi:hypothetical protein